MSSTQLLVLVNPGSIYHALKTLTRDGFLRVAQTGRRGARPERTAYELTTDGETEFVTLLRHTAAWGPVDGVELLAAPVRRTGVRHGIRVEAGEYRTFQRESA